MGRLSQLPVPPAATIFQASTFRLVSSVCATGSALNEFSDELQDIKLDSLDRVSSTRLELNVASSRFPKIIFYAFMPRHTLLRVSLKLCIKLLVFGSNDVYCI